MSQGGHSHYAGPNPANWTDDGRADDAQREQAPAPPKRLDGKFGIASDQSVVNLVSGEAIPDDEPLFLLRARDGYALAAINAYQAACEGACNDLHLAGIQQVREKFCQFEAEHPERMKQPGITKHLKLEASDSLSQAAREIALNRHDIANWGEKSAFEQVLAILDRCLSGERNGS